MLDLRYTEHYEALFQNIRRRHREGEMKPRLRLLEIGVKDGGSIEMWKQYFPGAEVLIGFV